MPPARPKIGIRHWALAAVGCLLCYSTASPAPSLTFPPDPVLAVAGSRFLAATPQPWANSVALKVTGFPPLPVPDRLEDTGCVLAYVQADGHLASKPVFQSAQTWGTVYIHGTEIVPHAEYTIQAVDSVTGHTSIGAQPVVTDRYGDVTRDDIVDVDDLIVMLNAFSGYIIPPATIHTVDVTGIGQAGCPPDHFVDVDDVLNVLDAVQGLPFSCELPCD